MKDYSFLPNDVRDYVYDDEIIIDLNGGYYIPRVDEVIEKIKNNGFKFSFYEDSKTAIVIKPENFVDIVALIDMPYSL